MFRRHHLHCCVLVPFQLLCPPYGQGKGVAGLLQTDFRLRTEQCAKVPAAVAGSGWKEQAPRPADRKSGRWPDK